MSAPVSVISFKINGAKDKNFVIDELYGSYDSVCLQEHRLTASSLLFLSPAKVTGGCPSGGLACVFKRDIHLPSPVLFYFDDFFLAVRVGSTVFINSYLPYEGYSIRSLTKFSKTCGLLKNLVNQVL